MLNLLLGVLKNNPILKRKTLLTENEPLTLKRAETSCSNWPKFWFEREERLFPRLRSSQLTKSE